jgi:3-hexulose-6-phosphate synthase/6-phospho-3-hexuloisomerase
MRVADKPARAKELEKLGVDYLNMHVSIDEQMIAHTPLQELKAVAAATSIPVAVAGGLNSETVGEALKAGASIVIVGGAIIKAENVAEATRTIKKAIHQRKSIPTGLYKKYTDADVGEAFRRVSTPNLADAMQKRGVMTGLVPRIKHGTKLVGRALTVKTADGDWAKPVEAIDRARPGDVIVIDVGSGPTAVWGELASNSCIVKHVAGVVIDGAVRDLDSIIELNFPCFSRRVAPHAGEPKGLGEIGSEIECGGQRVHTGDWIVGDESGVIVVPQEQAVEMANRALDVLERENRIREEIKRGGTLSSVLELEKWEQIR